MRGVAVALLAEDRGRLNVLQRCLEDTQMGEVVLSNAGFPGTPADSLLRQIQELKAEVVLVDIDLEQPARGLQALELIHASGAEVAVFAIGGLNEATTVVAAMRAGAREYLEHNVTASAMVEALNRFLATRGKTRTGSSAGRARVITVANAKGGSGATTVAVNTAVALQEVHGGVLLVDFATLGHAALHLNVHPSFGVADALQNLHRLDSSLLDGLLTKCKGGLQLLAGPQEPYSQVPTAAELARLFDVLVAHFSYVVVDSSDRADQAARLLCDLSNAVLLVTQADVVSLWSAGRMKTFLEEGVGRERVRLVLNRYKKIPGFDDEDVETATSCKLLWKVPNNHQAIAPAIDKGVPVAFQDSVDVGRSFRQLAAMLADAGIKEEGSLDLVYQADKSDSRKKPARLMISPARAGQ